jgi:hypothetical protein
LPLFYYFQDLKNGNLITIQNQLVWNSSIIWLEMWIGMKWIRGVSSTKK